MIETTLTLSIATGVIIAAAVVAGFCLLVEKITGWYNHREYIKRQKVKERSSMVKRFQHLAGITNSYKDDDGTLRN